MSFFKKALALQPLVCDPNNCELCNAFIQPNLMPSNFLISKYIWLLMWLYVFVKQVSCGKGHFTEFALVSERARKMDVFYVHPQIAPGWSSFATNGTTVHICSHLWIGHNILIQQLVTTCNSRMCSITHEMGPLTFHTPSSRGCSVLF